ncbi:MAG: hypothetical protein IH872_08955 [Chloroflexi bacterium]|nr:hypothetical protein [Chloroflexota bacterium]
MDFYDIFPDGLDIDRAYNQLEPVAFFIIGMTVFALFVFRFYRFVSSKDVFVLDVSRYERSRFQAARVFLHIILYAAKYLFIFPLVAFFWFAAITLMLSFLATNQDSSTSFKDILLVAMTVVGIIRVCAYISEDLARDLAKMLPFAVLAFLILDLSSFEASDSLEVLKQVDDNREVILYYLGFTIGLEFALRFASAVVEKTSSVLFGRR